MYSPSPPGTQSTLRVLIYDQDGASLPGVPVAASPVDGGRTLEATANAYGEVVRTIPPGKWKVKAELTGLRPVQTTVQVLPGQDCTVRFYLRITPTSAVTVVERARPPDTIPEGESRSA